MKYLKTFKIFEANAPIEPGNKSWRISAFMKGASLPHDMQLDIHDMSYELRDEGYTISYQWWPPYDKDSKSYQRNKYPSISITKRIEADENDENSSTILEEISYVDIKDFCERVSSYLDDMDYNVNIKWRKENLANLEYNLTDSEDKDEVTSQHFKIDMISKDLYGDVNESKNYKVIPDDIYQGALKELWSEGQFDNIDDLFGFYDYWLTVGDSELPYYDPIEVKERLVSFYSSPPCEGEEWFPMFTSDSDTVEVIMNELSRLYADASFKNGDYRCHNCHRIFKQTNRYQTMCSSSCENEYDEKMSDWRE